MLELKKIGQRSALLMCLFFLCSAFTGDSPGAGKVMDDLYVVGRSEQRFQELYAAGAQKGYFYYEELTRELLPAFKGLPYGAGGSGCPADKTLVNFFSFDCVTFVETYWALVYTIYEFHAGKVRRGISPFVQFGENLNRIRYFGGENCGMEFRIHYFTQQMEELDRSGLVFNVGIANGYPFKKRINYISEHPDTYGDFAASRRQKTLESALNKTPRFYYPMRHRALYYPMAQDGDIIAFSSVEPGLDVSHCGIVTLEDGKPQLNHASGKYEKIVLGQDLDYYLAHRTKVNGFFVYRPRFQ
ncbi:MAG: N-acetylmuramoyl-L-alanine amidase-like domain-containing protein [Bacteroidota bacterium]